MRRLAVCAAVVGATLLATGCGTRSPAPDQRTKRPIEPALVCTVTETVRLRMLDGTSFASLVDLPPRRHPVRGVAAAISLLRSRHRADLGRYEAVVQYLDRVGEVTASGKGDLPTATAAVRASARALDRDLADGLCER